MKKNLLIRIGIALALIAAGAGGRIILQDVPNVETIMVATILAGSLLGGRWGLVVGLGAVALSDAFIGNTNIMLFTWTAWAIIGFSALLLHRSNKTSWTFVPKAAGMGIGAVLLFYLWTNFGVWFLAGMYAPTFDGLIQSYTMALPFLRFHLLSTLVSVPVGAAALVLTLRHVPSLAFLLTKKSETAQS